ncbi:hypothetical protein K3495_g10714 [Podosphaera aphanis]|nr:hypothetical protein K3495_g10714 [Podosphaera aphanis]
MPLPTYIHESLPYIDVDISTEERAAALALVATELDQAATLEHPLLPPAPAQKFSPMILAELDRIQGKLPLQAIELSRYESQERPPSTESDSMSWHSALRSTYISQSYLMNRKFNLECLDKYGRTAWLIGNSQLEDILRDLERELADKKADIDVCVIHRRSAQEAVCSEISGLEENWKRGVGAVLETEVAAEKLKKEILYGLKNVANL